MSEAPQRPAPSADASEKLVTTPAETIGPFFGYALPFEGGGQILPAAHPLAIRLHGTVRDGAGEPISDALIETWQLDDTGTVPTEAGSLRRGHAFTGFGRVPVDSGGRYELTTLVPGCASGRAPFIAVTVFARGLLDRLFTRVYLPVDDQELSADPFLRSLPETRRHTLIAVPDSLGFRFDIRLQGEDETVFLSFPRHRTSG